MNRTISWRRLTPETPEEVVWWEAEKAKDEQKERARAITAKFMRDNFIRKPACECLVTKTQVHHVDYDRPLIVAFLCLRCHAAEHSGRLQRAFRIHDLMELVANPVMVPA